MGPDYLLLRESDNPISTATTDNVAVVAHDQTSRTGIDRRDGFLNQIASKYPNIEVVSVQYGAGDQL
jgi:ribose transport system substrate-binding protein